MSAKTRRSVKRQAKRPGKGRRPYQPTKVSVRVDEICTVFLHMELLFDKLERGSIETVNGKPIMAVGNGEWCEVAHGLSGWVDLWRRIRERWGLALDLGPLQQLANRLYYGTPLTAEGIAEARAVVDRCREIYRCIDPIEVRSLVRTQCIQYELENLKGKIHE